MLDVKTRVLWSSLKEKSKTKYNSIKTLLGNISELETLQILQTLDAISPGLSQFYQWLDNSQSAAVYVCSPFTGTGFSKFDDLQIQLDLWRTGENWEDISLKLFGDTRYSFIIKQHAESSGIFSKLDGNDPDDFSFALTGNGFHIYQDNIRNMSFDKAIIYSLKMVKYNYLLSSKIASSLKVHPDFNMKTF